MFIDSFYTGKDFFSDFKNYLRWLGPFLWYSPIFIIFIVAAWIWMAIPLGLLLGYSLRLTLSAYFATATLIGLHLWFSTYIWSEYRRLKFLYLSSRKTDG